MQTPKMTSMMSLWVVFTDNFRDFANIVVVSLVDFEQVNAGWANEPKNLTQ